jgi:hypothetical protein
MHQHQASCTFTEDQAQQLAAEYRRDHGRAVGAAGSSPVSVLGASNRADRSVLDPAPSLDVTGADGSNLRGHQVQLDWLGSTVTTLAVSSVLVWRLSPSASTRRRSVSPRGHYYQGSAGQVFYRRLAAVGLFPPGGGFEDDARSRPASASPTSNSPRGTRTRSLNMSWPPADASSRTS